PAPKISLQSFSTQKDTKICPVPNGTGAQKTEFSEQDTDDASPALVDDARYGAAHLLLYRFAHRAVFHGKFLAEHLFERAPEHIGIPRAFGFLLHALGEFFDERG